MSCTAAVSLSSSTIYSEQKTTVSVTVTNGGTSAVNIKQLVPWTKPAQALIPSKRLDNMTLAVAGSSGTNTVTYDLVACSNQNAAGSFIIGASVYTDDGSWTTATTAALTISAPAEWHPS